MSFTNQHAKKNLEEEEYDVLLTSGERRNRNYDSFEQDSTISADTDATESRQSFHTGYNQQHWDEIKKTRVKLRAAVAGSMFLLFLILKQFKMVKIIG
jgi:hypothetical protein